MANPIPLSQLAETIPLRKQILSERVADELLQLFRISLIFTVSLTASLAAVDYFFIAMKWISATERLITEKILMSIIGATIIQLGAVVAAIVYALFKQPKSDAEAASVEAD